MRHLTVSAGKYAMKTTWKMEFRGWFLHHDNQLLKVIFDCQFLVKNKMTVIPHLSTLQI